MSSSKEVKTAASSFEQAARIREMCCLLQRFLDGEVTRHEIVIWCHSVWPPSSGQGSPFRGHGDASCVFDSIWNMDETTSPGEYMVRNHDIASYIRLLREGNTFLSEKSPLVVLASGWEAHSQVAQIARIRYWESGLGWTEYISLSAAHNGRAFVVAQRLSPYGDKSWWVHMRRDDDWTLALRDLFEELGIDDGDTIFIAPNARVDELPCWSVWRLDDNGQTVEMEVCKSYAKAIRIQNEKERLGHKQTYWVEIVRRPNDR